MKLMKLPLLAGLAALVLPTVAQARWHGGWGFGFGIGVRPYYSYVAPPVYYPPVYSAPAYAPAYYPPTYPYYYGGPSFYYSYPYFYGGHRFYYRPHGFFRR